MLSNIRLNFKKSLKESYHNYLKCLIISTLVCPHCKANGLMKIHAYYDRHVVSWNDNQLIHEVLRILRLICQSCKTTHALLPDFIIPYCTYSNNLILECVKGYYDKQKILDLCEKYGISYQVLYSWIKRFKEHKAQCILMFKKGKVSFIEILNNILSYNDLSDFLFEFFDENKICFMQIIKPPG